MVFAASATYLARTRVTFSRALILGAIFFLGAVSIQLRNAPAAGTTQLWLNSDPVTVTAHVIAEGNVQSVAPDTFRQRIDVETEKIEDARVTRDIVQGVRLTIFQEAGRKKPTISHPMPLFHYGQRIRFPATLIAPRNYRNPGAFDYAGYLHDEGVTALASAKYSDVQLLPGFSGNRSQRGRSWAHRRILEKIHALWPERVAGLMDAIVIGEQTFVERSTRVDFQRSGTYHVLVVSGMNVSILAMFTLWSLRRIGFGEVIASGLAIASILAYALLTEQGSPVWRAALMFAAYLCTRLFYRDRAMLNALGLAAMILLVADPRILFSASFQMTFLCVALVAGVGIPILERTIRPYSHGLRNLNVVAYDRVLASQVAQFRLDIRLLLSRLGLIFHGRVPRILTLTAIRFSFAFCELVIMSAILQFGLALPMAYYFHRATSVAMPANLFVIPFLELLMPAAVSAICVSYISLSLARIPAFVAGFALQGITGTVTWLGGMRLADIRVATPGVSALLFGAVTIFLCAILVRRHRMLASNGVLLLVAGALWIWLLPAYEQIRANVLEMTAIDVGQGDSILVITPQGRNCWWMPEAFHFGRTRSSTSARTSSRRICGRAESHDWMQSLSLMRMQITWAACLR